MLLYDTGPQFHQCSIGLSIDLLEDSARSISRALKQLSEVFRQVVLPGQLQLYVSSSAHSCPPGPPPYETAGRSSPSADG